MFKPGNSSLLCKHLTDDIWASLKHSNDSSGFSFKQAIFPGCRNSASLIGVYAGSPDSYIAFAPLFDRIIKDYHRTQSNTAFVSDIDISSLDCPLLKEQDRKPLIKLTVSMRRNLAN